MVAASGFLLTNRKLAANFGKLNAEVTASNRCISSSQCALEETGNDPCGGFSGLIAFSITDAKSVRKIRRLASQTRSIQANLNREDREKSAPQMCAGYMPLEAVCENGKCVDVPVRPKLSTNRR